MPLELDDPVDEAELDMLLLELPVGDALLAAELKLLELAVEDTVELEVGGALVLLVPELDDSELPLAEVDDEGKAFELLEEPGEVAWLDETVEEDDIGALADEDTELEETEALLLEDIEELAEADVEADELPDVDDELTEDDDDAGVELEAEDELEEELGELEIESALEDDELTV